MNITIIKTMNNHLEDNLKLVSLPDNCQLHRPRFISSHRCEDVAHLQNHQNIALWNTFHWIAKKPTSSSHCFVHLIDEPLFGSNDLGSKVTNNKKELTLLDRGLSLSTSFVLSMSIWAAVATPKTSWDLEIPHTEILIFWLHTIIKLK